MTHQPGLSFAPATVSLSRPGWLAVDGRYGGRVLWALAVPGLLVALWSLAASQTWLPAQILPSPATVGATLLDLARSGDLTGALRISLWRIALGFAGGAVLGLVVGAALGLSDGFDAWVGPTVRAIAQVPTLGWLPFLILLLGLGEPLNLILIGKAAFVPMVVSTSRAIRFIPPAIWDVARVLRLRRITLLRRMVIPATLPMVFAGLRQALGNGWIALIVVEMLAGDAGVGYLIVWGRTLFQIDVVIAGMLIIGVIGFAMDAGLRAVERRLRRWDAVA
jgi:sulfonate transport system permease protein